MSKDRIIIIGSGETGKGLMIAEQLSKLKEKHGEKYQVVTLEEAKAQGLIGKGIDPPLIQPPPPLVSYDDLDPIPKKNRAERRKQERKAKKKK